VGFNTIDGRHKSWIGAQIMTGVGNSQSIYEPHHRDQVASIPYVLFLLAQRGKVQGFELLQLTKKHPRMGAFVSNPNPSDKEK
jgi:hypothetical protein